MTAIEFLNLLKFSNAMCEVLHLGWGNPQHQYRLGEQNRVRAALRRRLLGILADDKLNINQEWVLAAQKANYIQLASVANKLRGIS